MIDSRTVFKQNAENISPVEDFNRALIFCCPRLFWFYNVLTSRTLSLHALSTVFLLVLNKNTHFIDVTTTFRAVTEKRFISVDKSG